MDLHILPECYIDTLLIKTLVPPTTRYNHQKRCSTVAKVMKEKFNDTFALGIIDNDKRLLSYLNEFELIYEQTNNLQLLKHKQKHHYFIIICPAMEMWLLNNVKSIDMSMADFGLPDDLAKLQKITKTATSENENPPYSSAFKKMFNTLKIKEAKGVLILQLWVNYLKTNTYTADLKLLLNQTNDILM